MQSPSNPYETPASEASSDEPLSLGARIFSSVGWGLLITVVTYGASVLANYFGFRSIARILVWASDWLVTLVLSVVEVTDYPTVSTAIGFAGIPFAIAVYSLCAFSLSAFLRKRRRA